jgi:hypothetical protein
MQETLDKQFFGDHSGEGTIIDPTIHKDGDTRMQQMDPMKDNLRLVENGKLDRKTGKRIPLTSKAQTIMQRNLCPSTAYLDGFDQIKWDAPQKGSQRKGYKVNYTGKWYV